MRIVVVGGAGLLGAAVVSALGPRGRGHDVIEASRSGAVHVDLTDSSSIASMYEAVGSIDAVAVAAGSVPMGSVDRLSVSDFRRGVDNKLLGQIDLVLQGISRLSEGGSFTLVSGITAYDPIAQGSALSSVNSAVDGFVRGAALDMPRGLRINSVNGTVFAEAAREDLNTFAGFKPVAVADVAQAFVKSIEGAQTGQTYRVGH